MKPATPLLVAALNQAIVGTLTTLCDFDLYTITDFAGNVYRYTTADFDINCGAGTNASPGLPQPSGLYPSEGVRIDQDSTKAVGHWKTGLDNDQWTVVFMPRAYDEVTGTPFPDKIGSVPFIQALQSGAWDAADVQVDRAYFSTLPTWPMTPGGAVPLGTITIFAGIVGQVNTSDVTAVVVVNDYRVLTTYNMPRHYFQAGCRHMLFDSGCNANGNIPRGSYGQGGIVAAGSTAGSIVAAAGSRTNILPYSNNFSTFDNLTNCTVTGGQSGSPDGLNDAWLWQRSQTTAYIGNDTTYAGNGGPYTFSIYAKPGTGNYLGIYFSNQSGDPDAVRYTFNVATGVVSLSDPDAGITASAAITGPDTEGYYRCAVTATFPGNVTQLRPYFSCLSTNTTADGTDSSLTTTGYVFGAQLEPGAVATPLINTTGASKTINGLPAPTGSGTYSLGTLQFTSGLNNNFWANIVQWDGQSTLSLLQPLPYVPQPGDQFVAYPGCDKTKATCLLFSNGPQFGGEEYIPTPETMVAG